MVLVSTTLGEARFCWPSQWSYASGGGGQPLKMVRGDIHVHHNSKQNYRCVLRSLFARYGLPKDVVTENGPQFTSAEFAEFMCENGIRNFRSAPYHPATNGAAERCVQTLKNALRAQQRDTKALSVRLAQFLIAYRSTPHSTTGLSPAQLFLKRPIKTRLDIMRPKTEDRVERKQEEQRRTRA